VELEINEVECYLINEGKKQLVDKGKMELLLLRIPEEKGKKKQADDEDVCILQMKELRIPLSSVVPCIRMVNGKTFMFPNEEGGTYGFILHPNTSSELLKKLEVLLQQYSFYQSENEFLQNKDKKHTTAELIALKSQLLAEKIRIATASYKNTTESNDVKVPKALQRWIKKQKFTTGMGVKILDTFMGRAEKKIVKKDEKIRKNYTCGRQSNKTKRN